MANTLLIEKQNGGYFKFTLNGDTSNAITSIQNDLLAVGNELHFKTGNGANIIKEQSIYPADVTIVAAGTFTFTTVAAVWNKLIDVGYFDWLGGGVGGVDRFDELLDTFQYTGNAGKAVVVDNSELKLVPITLYNKRLFTELEDTPNDLVPDKMVVVNPAGTALILKDQPEPPEEYLNSVGYFDYEDLLTQTVPLAIVANVPKKLTNDTEGVNTNTSQNPYGVSFVWDYINNQFNFSELSIGDTIDIRIHVHITTTSNNQKVILSSKFGIGSASQFENSIYENQFKSSGVHEISFVAPFYIGSNDIKDYPAELYLTSDASATVKVSGWYVRILRKNINIITVDYQVEDATTTTKGIVRLAGDLSGTANNPTVPELANKVPTSRTVSTTSPLLGGGALSNNLTLSIQQANSVDSGYLSNVDWSHFESAYADKIVSAAVTGTTTKTLTLNQFDGGTVAASWTDNDTAITIGTPANGLGLANQVLSLGLSSATTIGALSSTDWTTFNSKQNALSGTGIVKSVGGTISYLTDNTTNWDDAYNNKIVSAAVTGVTSEGITTKTLKLNQQDGGFIQADWTDENSVISVFGRTGVVVAATGDYTTTLVTEGSNLYYTDARVSANTDVSANTAKRHDVATIGTANGLSLSGQALSLALSSATTNGALSSTDWTRFDGKQGALNGTGFVKISGTTISYDNSTYVPTSRTITINGTGFDLSANRTFNVGTVTSVAALTLGTTGTDVSSTIANGTTTPVITLNIPTASATNRGALSSTDWNTFNAKPIVGVGFSSGYLSGDNVITSYNVSTNVLNPSNLLSVDYFSSPITQARSGDQAGAKGIGFIIYNQSSGGTNKQGSKLLFSQYGVLGGSYIGVPGSVNDLTFGNINSSNVLSEAMRIMVGGNVGIGTISPGALLDVNGSIYSRSGSILSNNFGGYSGSDVNFTTNTSGGANLIFKTSLTERIRIDSGGNVGIGTTSPASKFVVSNGGVEGIEFGYSSGLGGNYFESLNRTNNLSVDILYYLGNNAGNANHRFFTSGSERMRITSGGDVGIGVTSTSSYKLYVAGGQYGTYLRGGDLGIGSAALNVVKADNSTALYVRGDGNIGIGTTSPTVRLDVLGAVKANGNAYGAEGGFIINFGGSTSSRSWRLANDLNAFGDFSIQQSTTQTGSTYTDRLYINPSGNVGIGNTSPLTKLHIEGNASSTLDQTVLTLKNNGENGTRIDFRNAFGSLSRITGTKLGEANLADDGVLIFETATDSVLSEKMRITSGGDVLVGIQATYTNSRYQGQNITGSKSAMALRAQATTGSTILEFWNPNGQVGSVSTNGSLTSFNVTSDYRLKQDFKPFNGLDLVSKIKVYDYEWKSDNSRMNGVIAHELQEVVPYAVTGEKDAEQMQSVDYSKLVPILVQAIQELNDKINKLENK